ncbi:MAG TPA: aromatic acid exporter family protein [Pseudonocardiaceae bacterium]|nr:aromatic acid exporter family protein [Pseudonocardiaceae bacterium]
MRSTTDAVRRAWAACFRRGRTPGLRTVKTTVAAVLAFQCADLLHTSSQPILAPLTALLVVQLTLYRTRPGCPQALGCPARIRLGSLVTVRKSFQKPHGIIRAGTGGWLL